MGNVTRPSIVAFYFQPYIMRQFFWVLALAAVTATAQKTISLEDAVLQQGRKFRADRMTGFQWIPNSQSYTYLADSGKQLMSASACLLIHI